MASTFDTLSEITSRVSSLHATTDIASLSDDDLKLFMRLASGARQSVERVLAAGSAEINQRSRREFGGAGLAKTSGHVNPQSLIAALTGATKADARKIDHLGKSLMQASPMQFPAVDDAGEPLPADPDSGPISRPWFGVITDRMSAGSISPDRYEAIRSGLGDSSDTVPAEALAAAAERLLELLHPEDAPERVYRDAQQARAFLDRAGVLEREKELRARQQAKIYTDRDGLVHLRATFAPEDGAWFTNTLNLLLGPKIGGPRFVNGAAADEAKRITADPRSTDQIRADFLVSLLKAGALVDENTLLAQKRPSVQVVVTASEITRPNKDGVAFIEGTGIPISAATVDRLVCNAGYVTSVHSDDGSPLNLGRNARLFSPVQRVMIAGLQGGCTVATCDAPPSFCEIHHITPWVEGGATDILDGIMLCRFHHMQLHNHGHRIHRNRGQALSRGATGKTGATAEAGSGSPRYEDSYYWIPAPTPGEPDPPPVKLRFRGIAHNNAFARCAPERALALSVS